MNATSKNTNKNGYWEFRTFRDDDGMFLIMATRYDKHGDMLFGATGLRPSKNTSEAVNETAAMFDEKLLDSFWTAWRE